MCVGVVAWQAHPRWRLLVAANRDEFHDRPAAPLASWPGPHSIIAGRDLTAGGTWLGVSPAGRFAFVTNRRMDGDTPPPRGSRGALVSDWLADRPLPDPASVNPYNLIIIDQAAGARLLTNQPHPLDLPLGPGVLGLSNGPHDVEWPKTGALDAALRTMLASHAGDPSALFDALRDESDPPGSIAHGPEPAFPAVFVRSATYGTRSSTVVAIDDTGTGWIEERRFDPDGRQTGHNRISFCWPG